ncbi:MAG: type II toxin-antitoxin system RelE/ParE family toxin [Candidatus Entotheonellia bacterium]
MPTYRKTRRADEDLTEIYRYMRRLWGCAQAVSYIRGLEQRFTALADNPLSGVAREDLQPEGPRGFVHGSHIVFYQQQPYGVLIVLHGRQDARTHLGGAEEP